MIDDTIRIEELIQEISKSIDQHVDLYMIGGGAMMYLGSKRYTKDLDLVVRSEGEYDAIHEALVELGFDVSKPTDGMTRADLSDTLKKGEYRIDLFSRRVCGKLQLSDTMMARAVERIETENVCLYSCSAEDVFLLKSVTEREGDADDCDRLLLNSPRFDWDALIEEIRIQMGFGDAVWITYVAERLLRINVDFRFPEVFDSVSMMENEYMEEWAHRMDDSHDLRETASTTITTDACVLDTLQLPKKSLPKYRKSID
jgi:hypothetical protein